MNRTIKIMGQAATPTGCDVRVEIDDVAIYQGAAVVDPEFNGTYFDQFLDPTKSRAVGTWQEDIAFQGTRRLRITVLRGDFVYTRAVSNHMPMSYRNAPSDIYSSGDAGFMVCYRDTSGDTTVYEPNSNVTIDGVQVTREDSHDGQWYWWLPEGSVLTADLRIMAGLATPQRFDGSHVLYSLSFTGDGSTVEYPIKPTFSNVTGFCAEVRLNGVLQVLAVHPPGYNNKELTYNPEDVEAFEFGGTNPDGFRYVVSHQPHDVKIFPLRQPEMYPGAPYSLTPFLGDPVIRFNSPPPSGSSIQVDWIELWDMMMFNYTQLQ